MDRQQPVKPLLLYYTPLWEQPCQYGKDHQLQNTERNVADPSTSNGGLWEGCDIMCKGLSGELHSKNRCIH